MVEYQGHCLCGHISYKILEQPIFPHLCSCTMCQKWSGALTVAWSDFPLKSLIWNGPGGEPAFYRSSEKTQRGFCPRCGSSLCAVDDGSDTISMTIASLHKPSLIKPSEQHSYQEEVPAWWKVSVET